MISKKEQIGNGSVGFSVPADVVGSLQAERSPRMPKEMLNDSLPLSQTPQGFDIYWF